MPPKKLYNQWRYLFIYICLTYKGSRKKNKVLLLMAGPGGGKGPGH